MVEILKTTAASSNKRLLSGSAASAQENDDATTAPAQSTKLPNRTREELEQVFADEITELKEAAYDEAFSNGYEEGQQAAQEDFRVQKEKWQKQADSKELELNEKIEHFDSLLTGMQTAIDNALKDIEPAAVAIAFAGLTQLLGQAEQYRERLAQQVHYAIDQFGHDSPTRILLNTADAEMLRTVDRLNTWSDRFIQEEKLERGSCIIESGPRSLEASLTEQLAILRRTLLQLRETEA